MEETLMKTITIILVLLVSALTFSSCETNSSSTSESSSNSGNGNGTGNSGSTAQFIISDHYLYTVDKTTRLFDLSAGTAKFLREIPVGFSIETIFALGNTLFLGASDGVHIYDITSREAPQFLSTYQHIVSCDPVVADQSFAYCTLSTGRTRCSRGINSLDIIDINDLHSPFLVQSFQLSNPQGLGLVGTNRLVVCDNGLKLFDISERSRAKLLNKSTVANAYDIIPNGNTFTAVVPGGFSNFKIDNDSIQLVGKLIYK